MSRVNMTMIKPRQKIKLTVEKTGTGFSAYSQKFPLYTTGTSVPELLNNSYEAVQLFFDDGNARITREDIQFEIDFKQFFQFYKVLNSKFLAEKIGMNPTLLSQYVQGRKKPGKAQTEKILAGIHEIGKELSEISLIHRH